MLGHEKWAFLTAWANEQARLIRAGRFDLLGLEHIAEEIEDVGKSEQRELETRMAVLLAHLLKWQFQPERRGSKLGEHDSRPKKHGFQTNQQNTLSKIYVAR